MTPAPGKPGSASGGALYVYCVAKCDANRILGPIGLDGQPVFTIHSHGLCAVVHDCPDQAYQSPDPRVVEAWVMAHQIVVVEASKAFGTVLPMAFDMIIHDAPDGGAAGALKAWLDEKHDRFVQLLNHLSGKAEYGVQVLWDRRIVAESLVAGDEELRKLRAEAQDKPRGLAHVLQQKLAKAVRSAMEKHADKLAADFYARIRRCVDDVRIEKLKKVEDDRQMLLNLSCLMAPDREDLGRELDEIQKTEGVTVRFTGPWPPYGFVG